jgi:hypothetical protein
MKLLITPPFDTPVAPHRLDRNLDLGPILADYGVELVDEPLEADFELLGIGASLDPSLRRLPTDRAILVDGEPPQPDYLLPHFTVEQAAYAALLTPANHLAYAPDGMAFYEPPLPDVPRKREKRVRVIQLATYRSRPGNANDGTHLIVQQEGRLYCHRVLCNLRAEVGRALQKLDPTLIDICGRGWPPDVIIRENSRGGSDFVARRLALVSDYGFDLCWENMEVPHYVSEKFWSAVRSGVLPIYWGPPEFHARLPADSIVDARGYLLPHGGFDVERLRGDLTDMSEVEYLNRLGRLLDWYESLDHESAYASWVEAAHVLGRRLQTL